MYRSGSSFICKSFRIPGENDCVKRHRVDDPVEEIISEVPNREEDDVLLNIKHEKMEGPSETTELRKKADGSSETPEPAPAPVHVPVAGHGEKKVTGHDARVVVVPKIPSRAVTKAPPTRSVAAPPAPKMAMAGSDSEDD